MRRGSETEVDAPTAAELEWIRANLEVAGELAAMQGAARTSVTEDPAVLDRIFDSWLADWEEGGSDARGVEPNDLVNAVGLAFGQLLVDTLGFEWVVATDAGGTELAVRAQPGDVLVYPANAAAKRLERRETGAFVPLYREVRARVEELRPSRGASE